MQPSPRHFFRGDGDEPPGRVVTRRDALGRTVRVERPGDASGEYDTDYAYDAEGHLAVESSTNGTGRSFAYDALGRVSLVREQGLDGHSLETSYAYFPGGSQLSEAAYRSERGLLATEHYAYAHGHATGITLSDGTVVWRLESEDAWGNPARAVSGGVVREYGHDALSGLPTVRRLRRASGGSAVQDFTYAWDAPRGNLTFRRDGRRDREESFTYDAMNRLSHASATEPGLPADFEIWVGDQLVDSGSTNLRHVLREADMSWSALGNFTSRGDVGGFSYSDPSHPYRVTAAIGGVSYAYDQAGNRESASGSFGVQCVTYTCYHRPAQISHGTVASFTYDGGGARVKMSVRSHASLVLDRHYLGDRYECDVTPSGVVERLWLGGDAYSAPMALERRAGSAAPTYYVIGRDYLGSVTQVCRADGSLLAEYSYDAWGRLRNPSTLGAYAAGDAPELVLGGRGYTGHEHLPWFSLINMNARLYDPVLGRFLSPDPYVSDPAGTQGFNRYAYGLNNPFKYTDPSGEMPWVIPMIFGAVACFGQSAAHVIENRYTGWNAAWRIIVGTAVGAAGGALGGVAGAAAASVAGVGGAVGGAVAGLAGGAVGTFTTTFFMNWLCYGQSFGDSFGSAVVNGIVGGLSGAFMGGLMGGLYASSYGGDFWTGERWIALSFSDAGVSSDPGTLLTSIDFDVKRPIGRYPNDCVVSTGTEYAEYLGIDMYDYDYFEYWAKGYGYVRYRGLSGSLDNYRIYVENHYIARRVNPTGFFHAENVNQIRQIQERGDMIFVHGNFPYEGRFYAHMDMVRSVRFYSSGEVRVVLRIGTFSGLQLSGTRPWDPGEQVRGWLDMVHTVSDFRY